MSAAAGLFPPSHPNSVASRAAAAAPLLQPLSIPLTGYEGATPPAPNNLLAGIRSRASTETINSGNEAWPPRRRGELFTVQGVVDALAALPPRGASVAANAGRDPLEAQLKLFTIPELLAALATLPPRGTSVSADAGRNILEAQLTMLQSLRKHTAIAIESRFQKLFALTQDALGESKQVGARGLEAAAAQKAVGGLCATLSSPVEVSIVFIRHSESCANVLKRNTIGGGFTQTWYTDPELSGRGIQMAKDRPSTLRDMLRTYVPDTQWIVGSSTLFRAEQTAMYLSDGISGLNASDRIVVFPYIQETGGGQENVAMSEANRLKNNLYEKLPGGISSHERIVTTLFDKAENPSNPDIDIFSKWLGCNLALVNQAGRGDPSIMPLPAKINLLIVTHSNFMTALYKKFRSAEQPPNQKYNNLEAMGVRVVYTPTTTQKPSITIVKNGYEPDPILIKQSCPDSVCRKDVCPKSSSVATATPAMAAAAVNSATPQPPPQGFAGVGVRAVPPQMATLKPTLPTIKATKTGKVIETVYRNNEGGLIVRAPLDKPPKKNILGPFDGNARDNLAFYGVQEGGARHHRKRRATRHHRTPTRSGRRTQKCRH